MTRFDEHFAFDSDEFEFLYTKKIPDNEESAWKKIVNKLRKHRQGQHDQSTHGGKSGFNVPSYVDIEGKRFSKEAAQEYVNRRNAWANAAESKYAEVKEEIAQQVHGKSFDELTDYQQRSLGYENEYRKIDGKWQERNWQERDWQKKGQSARDVVNADPEVKALKDHADNHYLMKDAMNQLAWNEDGTLGPKTIGEVKIRGEDPREFLGRYLQVKTESFPDNSDYSKRTSVPKRGEDGVPLKDANGRTIYEDVVTSKEVAERLHGEAWQAFGEAAYPEVIVSNKALRSILADGEIKTYTTENRPARAGASDAEYKNSRAIYESVAFGYDNTTDISNRPVSGLLTAFNPHQDILSGYGNTQIILKPSVLARTTATYDDSLNGFYQPQTVSSFLSRPQNQYATKNVAAEVSVNGNSYYTKRPSGVYNTPEIQIHGGVKLSDIDKIVFRDTAPAQITNKLTNLGIPYEVTTIEEVN